MISDPAVISFARRHQYLGVDTITRRDLGSELANSSCGTSSKRPLDHGDFQVVSSHPDERAHCPPMKRTKLDSYVQHSDKSKSKAPSTGGYSRRPDRAPASWDRNALSRGEVKLPKDLGNLLEKLPVPQSFDGESSSIKSTLPANQISGPLIPVDQFLNVFRQHVFIPSSSRDHSS